MNRLTRIHDYLLQFIATSFSFPSCAISDDNLGAVRMDVSPDVEHLMHPGESTPVATRHLLSNQPKGTCGPPNINIQQSLQANLMLKAKNEP